MGRNDHYVIADAYLVITCRDDDLTLVEYERYKEVILEL